MIKIENTEVMGWEAAIRGMRNPMNSWDKSDSGFCCGNDNEYFCDNCSSSFHCTSLRTTYNIGPNDLDLMTRLRNAGTDHRKFMRMITVYLDITAPMYWWSEYDTYKIGTVANSCSKMHKMLAKPFEMNDFSFDKLLGYKNEVGQYIPDVDYDKVNIFETVARPIIDTLNELRDVYLREDDKAKQKQIWYSILQLLPASYNQRRTVMLNYEVLANIYKSRRNHKLDEWRELCSWIETLPYSELITGTQTMEEVKPSIAQMDAADKRMEK